jgi:hypothetical protein
MTKSLSKQEFLRSEKAKLLRDELVLMVKSPVYNTRPLYSPNDTTGSQFVEKHMIYMSNFLGMDHMQYISNLKLKTKIRK